MKNRIASLIIALLLLTGFTANLQAQTVAETVEYLSGKLHSGIIIKKNKQYSQERGYIWRKDESLEGFKEVSGKYISFQSTEWIGEWYTAEQEALEGSTKIYYETITTADLSSVNFSISEDGVFKMFSDKGKKSISYKYRFRDKPYESDGYCLTKIDFTIINNDPKTRAGILKALKHLQKLLGCENGAQDQDARLKNLFEE